LLFKYLIAEIIFGDKHIISAYEHAKRAFEEKKIRQILLLWKSYFMHQVRDNKTAIPKIGIKKDRADIAFIFIGDKISDN